MSPLWHSEGLTLTQCKRLMATSQTSCSNNFLHPQGFRDRPQLWRQPPTRPGCRVVVVRGLLVVVVRGLLVVVRGWVVVVRGWVVVVRGWVVVVVRGWVLVVGGWVVVVGAKPGKTGTGGKSLRHGVQGSHIARVTGLKTVPSAKSLCQQHWSATPHSIIYNRLSGWAQRSRKSILWCCN